MALILHPVTRSPSKSTITVDLLLPEVTSFPSFSITAAVPSPWLSAVGRDFTAGSFNSLLRVSSLILIDLISLGLRQMGWYGTPAP